jgi:hypothetical protein
LHLFLKSTHIRFSFDAVVELNYADAKKFSSWCIGWLVMAGLYGKLADNLAGTPNFYLPPTRNNLQAFY